MIVRAWTNFVYESTVNTCCLILLIYFNNYRILMSYVDERALARVAGASQLLPLMTDMSRSSLGRCPIWQAITPQ
jgi:hypothetical protein